MCSQEEVSSIISQLSDDMRALFPNEHFDIILFGSYARNDAEDGSDIDVMYLVDTPRQSIAEKQWQIGEAAAELLLEHGIVVSPIVENRNYFRDNVDLLPFYRNIQREGVRVSG